MATLINGDGNLAIAAAQDADWFASIMGNQTSITGVGHQFAAEVISATEIALSDGVIITKEGRRIQLDTDQIDTFDIPAGGADITNYYIIGYYLYRDADSNELCEPFVELMDSSTATIEEETFKGGADEVFVSLYRVTFTEFAISNVQALLPSIDSIRQITTTIGQINTALTSLTWNTSTAGFSYAKFPNGLIFAYKRVEYTCGTSKSSQLYPNSYASSMDLSISDIGFSTTKKIMAYADVHNSYMGNLAAKVGINWNATTVSVLFLSDSNSGTWPGEIVLIGF